MIYRIRQKSIARAQEPKVRSALRVEGPVAQAFAGSNPVPRIFGFQWIVVLGVYVTSSHAPERDGSSLPLYPNVINQL